MLEALRCPQCGDELLESTPGLCPSCVIGLLDAASRDDDPIWSDETVGAEGSQSAIRDSIRLRYFGDYEILERVAAGGMGVVFKARQISLNRVVALKIMLAGEFASDIDIERFRCEAQAAANLDHPNIVPIYEIARLQNRDYFTMKYIEGENLAKQVPRFAADHRAAAALIAKVARAVHYGHQHGIIHRDVKPANIVLDRTDTPYLTDFGLAKHFEEDRGMTQAGALMGTPSYMAPEQAAGKTPLTTSVDVYSLGAILYELLVGRPPFARETKLATLQEVQEKEPQRPRTINPKVDSDLETVCLKCLEKDLSRRYGSAEALADDLERWLRNEPIEARPVQSWHRLVKLMQRRPAITALVMAVALLVVAVAVISTTAAFRLAERGHKLEVAQVDATDKLRAAYLAQAQARRFSGRPGRRFESLEVLNSARTIRGGMDLRNEAIAAMALADMRHVWRKSPARYLTFDKNIEFYYRSDSKGMLWRGSRASESEAACLTDLPKDLWVHSISSDSRFIALRSDSGETQVWDLQNRVRVVPPSGSAPDRLMPAVAHPIGSFSPDGRSFLYGTGDGLNFHDLHSGGTRHLPIAGQFSFPLLDPTGRKLAFTRYGSGTIRIHSASDGSLLKSFTPAENATEMAWHPDGVRLAVTCHDSDIRLLDTDTGQELTRFSGHVGEVIDVAFDATGTLLLSASWDNTTRLWDTETRRELVRASASGNGLQFAENGRRFSFISWDGSHFDFWEVAPGFEVRSLYHAGGRYAANLLGKGPTTTHLHPQGRILATAGIHYACLWDTHTGRKLAVLPTNGPIGEWGYNHAYFAPDARQLFSNGWRRAIEVQPGEDVTEVVVGEAVALPERRALLSMTTDAFPMVVVNRDGPRAVRIDDPMLAKDPASLVPVARVSPDGKWTAAWGGGKTTIWDRQSSQPRGVHAGGVVVFSPDSRWLVLAMDRSFRVLDLEANRIIYEAPRQYSGSAGASAAVSADGSILAVVSTPTAVRLIDTRSWTEFALLETPNPRPFHSMEFSAEGEQLIVASLAHMVDVWDLREIRRQLAEMNLDWDLPPYPPRPQSYGQPVHVTIRR